MPYIKKGEREEVDIGIEDLIPWIATSGQLNYVITKLCLKYLEGLSYESLNNIVGVLECVKLEFYRKLVSAYENKKIRENGDIEEYLRGV